MADENGAQGQEPGTGTTGAGQEPTGQQQGQDGQQGSGQAPEHQQAPQFDLSQIQDPALRAYLEGQQAEAREARREAANYRTQLRDVQQQHDQFRQQHETDEQRAQREAAEREQRLTALEAENRLLKVGPLFTKA